MMRSFLNFFISVFISSLCLTADAQVQINVEQINGKEYYMHLVEKGQTLYSISKTYKCDINDILSVNANADSGIKEGQIIRIPVDKSGVKKAVTQNTTSGQPFVLHEVKKKETLYSIAKLYNLDINDIVALNPGAADGIRKGQELKIPVKQKNASPPVQTAPANNVKHVVAQGETLYAISRQYNVSVEVIKSANPGMMEALNPGQEILIPVGDLPVNPDPTLPAGKVVVDGPAIEDSYGVALMLPFHTEQADTSGYSERELRQREVAVDLYRGVMMAKDTLEKDGLSASLFIYDVADEKNGVKQILGKSEMKSMDLIIGPLFREPFSAVSEWSAKNGVHVACPVPLSNRILLSSPNISKAYPGVSTQWESLGTFIAQHYKGANIITVNTTDVDDLKMLSVFNQAYLKVRGDSAKEFKASNRSASGISKLIVAGKTNVVVVPSNDRLFIATLFKNLSGDNIIVYGTEDWENLPIIEAEDRNKFHLHYPKAVFIDYTNATVQQWIETYRKKYKTEPTEYSVLGYDMMLFYGNGLAAYGKDFPNHFQEMNTSKLVGSGFDYFKTGNESGFENRHLFVLGTDNFEITPEK